MSAGQNVQGPNVPPPAFFRSRASSVHDIRLCELGGGGGGGVAAASSSPQQRSIAVILAERDPQQAGGLLYVSGRGRGRSNGRLLTAARSHQELQQQQLFMQGGCSQSHERLGSPPIRIYTPASLEPLLLLPSPCHR